MKKIKLKTKEKYSKGITLVALIVTIIVLLILAGVTIITLTGDNGLLTKSKSAVDKYSEGKIEEKIKLAYQEWQLAKLTGTTGNANVFIKNRLDSSLGNVEDVSVDDNALTVTINKDSEEKIYYYNVKKGIVKQIELALNSSNKDDSYVGCYADIDEDGTVDGIIFVDLLTRSIRDDQKFGYNSDGNYTITTDVTTSNVNTYYISQKNYTDAKFGTHSVISPKSTNGKQRFYIIQLSDFTTSAKTDGKEDENYPAYNNYYWYKNAVDKMSPVVTSNDFGKGYENTGIMIEKWNAAKTTSGWDADQDNQDIWKHIQTEYSKGWFIPSRLEIAAFANELGITSGSKGNFSSIYGLSWCYWTSSQANKRNSYFIDFNSDVMNCNPVSTTICKVRLAKTF